MPLWAVRNFGIFVHKTRALQLRREAQIKPPLRASPPCWATGTISTVVEHNSPIRNTRVLYPREAQTTCPCSYCPRYRLSRPSPSAPLFVALPGAPRDEGAPEGKKMAVSLISIAPLWGIGKESYVPERRLQKPSRSFCQSGNATVTRFWWTKAFLK